MSWKCENFDPIGETPNDSLVLSHSGICTVQLLNEFLSFSNLNQYNHVHNVSNNILDLILCSVKCRVIESEFPLSTVDVHHRPLSIDLLLNYTPTLTPATSYVYSFHSGNYEKINEELININ